MRTKLNDLRVVSNEPASIAALADSSSNIVVLDEASLEDVSGGVPPLAIVVGYGVGVAAGSAVTMGIAYVVKKLF